jgi:hypothetical protein
MAEGLISGMEKEESENEARPQDTETRETRTSIHQFPSGRTKIYQFPGGFLERTVFDDDDDEDGPGFYLALSGDEKDDQ